MFNWFDKLLVKIAKKILNRYAPKGEFIAYINEKEEKILKQLGGYGKPINETGIKSFISLSGIVSSATNFITKKLPFLQNPFVQLGITLFLSWVLRPKIPDQPDFGNNDFDNFEKKNGRKTNNTSQQRFFSTDVGMDFSSQTILDIKWGRE